MADDMRVRMILDVVDKALGPLRRIGAGSRAASSQLRETTKELKALKAQQDALAQHRSLANSLAASAAAAQRLRARLAELKAQTPPTAQAAKALARETGMVERQLLKTTVAADKQQYKLALLRERLKTMGVSAFAASEDRLRARMAAVNSEIDKQKAKLSELAKLKRVHGNQMMHLGMMGGAGAAAMAGGRQMSRPVSSVLGAYRQQEDSASQLQAAMMLANGRVGDEYQRMADLAQKLGDRLPGNTADF